MKQALEVDVEYLGELFWRQIQHGLAPIDPGTLTATSTRPVRSRASAAETRTLSQSRTSVCMAELSRPRPEIMPEVCRAPSRSMSRQYYVGAESREAQRDRSTKTGSCTRHHGAPAIEPEDLRYFLG